MTLEYERWDVLEMLKRLRSHAEYFRAHADGLSERASQGLMSATVSDPNIPEAEVIAKPVVRNTHAEALADFAHTLVEMVDYLDARVQERG